MFLISTSRPTSPVTLPRPALAQTENGVNPAQSDKQLARPTSLPIMPGPKWTVTSGTSGVPLLASEQTPPVLLQDALASTAPHPPASPAAETELQGANQTCCSPKSHPEPDKTVNRPGWASLLQPCGQDRTAGGQEAPWPRRQHGGSRGAAAIQPGERLLLALRGLQGKAEVGRRGRCRKRLHQWLPEWLPREKSPWWLLPLVPSSLGKEGESLSQGSWCPGQEGWGLGPTYSRPPWRPGVKIVRKAP